MNWASLDISILGPALLAGIIVLSTHVPLGLLVLKRGIIFLDLAVAQIAGLGLVAASILDFSTQGIVVQLIAAVSAIIGALLLFWTEQRWPELQEAIIGSSFVIAASTGILLLSNDPHSGDQIKDLLSGQILWTGYEQLIYSAILFSIILISWLKWHWHTSRITFYIVFAVTVTASVQLVGVYLVFSSLIIPALSCFYISKPVTRLLWCYGTGLAGYLSGLIISALADLPSGPMIALSLAICGIFSWNISHYLKLKASI
ncbi:MAG: metal ABC transporter permease [Gammaproteobacteria bacterium]|nr:metal ABC transporter permease [Gammaproteobacteria bacterium]